ncbi:pep-cterm sorting domain-containing protein [Anaeramoeba ignava]|uniref:Pep-cterm sorting domain-containing protein n=1 Tax=Anaeramoeba ignava TaxID=1746090 RepID=A0A9Q0RH28_ANAIG|nr:pep-cterm sorting domain-containing protein [Anaeramoeba ignava]
MKKSKTNQTKKSKFLQQKRIFIKLNHINLNLTDSNKTSSNEEISEDSETDEYENEKEDLIEIKNENQTIFKEKFINDFQNLFENENNNYSDFVIKSGKKYFQFNSHKSILSFRSLYFALLFKEKSINQIEFPEIRKPIMKKILEYIYTSKTQISKSELIEMLIVSNQFQLNLLSKFIENEIIKNINEKNVCDYLLTNQKMKSNQLENECLKFIIDNFDKFIQQNNTFKLTKKQMKYVIEKGTTKFKKIGIELFEMIKKWIERNEQKNNNEINQNIQKEKFNKIIEKFIPKINIKCLKNKTLKQIKKIEFLPNIFLIGIENLRNERIYQKQKLENEKEKDEKSKRKSRNETNL